MHSAVRFAAVACIFEMVYTLPGGFIDVAEDNDTVKELAEFAVNELGSAFELTDIIAAKKQVRNQRTNGPVNAHLISWPSKAQNIQNLKNIW